MLKISVVVPCFNMEKYIEDTLKSLIQQGYADLEIIVVDGQSTDGTLKIVEKYSEHIATIISEPDDGQYHAIQKGLDIATGDILCWLNADDVSFPWTLRAVANIFYNANVVWVTGVPAYLNDDGSLKRIYTNCSAKPLTAIKNGWFKNGGFGYLQQESMFWRRELWQKSGGLNLSLKLAADYDLWMRFAHVAELWTVNMPLSAFRVRKSSRSRQLEEVYAAEVDQVSASCKKLPILFRYLGKKRAINFCLRLLTWKKTPVIHQPFLSDSLVYETRWRSVSPLALSSLILEI